MFILIIIKNILIIIKKNCEDMCTLKSRSLLFKLKIFFFLISFTYRAHILRTTNIFVILFTVINRKKEKNERKLSDSAIIIVYI